MAILEFAAKCGSHVTTFDRTFSKRGRKFGPHVGHEPSKAGRYRIEDSKDTVVLASLCKDVVSSDLHSQPFQLKVTINLTASERGRSRSEMPSVTKMSITFSSAIRSRPRSR